MPVGILFWVLYVVSFIFGGWAAWPVDRRSGTWLIVMVLIGIIGWQVFGPVVQRN